MTFSVSNPAGNRSAIRRRDR